MISGESLFTSISSMLRRLLFLCSLLSFYLSSAQSISCYNCTSSIVCSDQMRCSGTFCFFVSRDRINSQGCSNDIANLTLLNGTTSANGVCYVRSDNSRLCVCRSKECNVDFEMDTLPTVDRTPLQSIDIDAQLQIALQTTTPSPTTTVAPGMGTTIGTGATTQKLYPTTEILPIITSLLIFHVFM